MGVYDLVASEPTVQVLSPTLTLNVLYTTIRTNPSGVIASIPVDPSPNASVKAGVLLQVFNDNIETIMQTSYVTAASGAQTIDDSGLLQDQVVFTVEYVKPGGSGTHITDAAAVPSTLLYSFSPEAGNEPLLEAEAIVKATYDNLVSIAGG